MLKPSVFEFVSYAFEPQQKRILFTYKQTFKNAETLVFTEEITLPSVPDASHVKKELLDTLLRDLHLILGVSYYKFYCAKKFQHPYKLSQQEAEFWNTMYREGLGEFYFRSNLDPDQSPVFKPSRSAKPQSFPAEKTSRFLIGFSGGKDSIVAAELLREQGVDVTGLFTQTNIQTELVDTLAKTMGIELVKINRMLDKKVFDKHSYNGHIPISAVYGFLGVLYALLYKYSYFVVANEYSSSFGNVEYKGREVNHQWSKSVGFETSFSKYIRECLTPDIKYFSLMRPFYEIRIAEMFAKHKKYFPYFSSCNKNFRVAASTQASAGQGGLWCGACAKCAFAFVMFSAFLEKEELVAIFHKNLYQDGSLLPLFKDIFGLGDMKPFDCVGTFEESQAAFLMGADKFKEDSVVKELLPLINLSKEKIEALWKAYPADNIPDYLRFSGVKNALLLGYGKEGKVSEQYLKTYLPQLPVGIADQNVSSAYLEMQKDFDIAIRSPGIHKSELIIPYTTATNIFFSKIKEQGNLIIGITGSKGKSTTTSLIYSILKEAGKKVSIMGNIGNPMLEVLLNSVDPDHVFVIELSSYQLDDIRYSPDIAVVTNLFPEHLDYHGGVEPYYQAKKNIIAFQEATDVFVYNGKHSIMRQWAKEAKTKTVKGEAGKFQSKLLGKHNQENIGLAVAVARELGIAEEVIMRAVADFEPLVHRLELVGEFKGIRFYDDAISTSPESTILAIETLKHVDTIFLGGEDRGYDFTQLEKVIKKYKIKNAVLFPESGRRITVEGLNVLETTSMEEAVEFAYKHTAPGKICLLSCASPSYSLWKNFEEKGDQFKKFVHQFSQ